MKPIQIGDIVGDYRVIAIAGSGGMGAVYKIEHIITKRIEAMKLLPPGLSSDPDQVQRFEREIQVQARLHHPNIVGLYNAVRQGESIALVMEYVEGESLQRMVEAGPLPVATAVDFASQVLCALAYAHEAGIIHRDVAPANIIITPERVAKLTDFGLARGATDVRLSTSGAPLGSPWYMSPEQIRGTGAVDGRTDIYAMGAVLHEMLTGGKLFVAEGSFAVMRAHVEAEPDPPSWRNPEVPAELDEIVRKALAKDPSMRFQKADEFRLALQGVAPGERPIAAAPVLSTPEAENIPDLTAVPVPAPAPAVPVPDAVPAPARVRPIGFHPSRAVIVMALLPTVMLAGFYAMRLIPGVVQARSTGSKPPAAIAKHNEAQVPAAAPSRVEPQAPATVVPAAVVPPAVAPAVVAPAPAPAKPPAQTKKPAVRARVQSSALAARRTGKSKPSPAIRVTGGDVLPAAAPAAPAPSRSIEVPEPPAPKTDAAADVAATQRAVSETVPEVTTMSPEAGPAKSQTGGNWFTRALGKVNPFRKAKAPVDN
jgi:serine/threonine-protein kinase